MVQSESYTDAASPLFVDPLFVEEMVFPGAMPSTSSIVGGRIDHHQHLHTRKSERSMPEGGCKLD